VNGDVGNIISGMLNSLPATGAYELQTTEFVAGSYLPNDPLTVSVAADPTKGKLIKAVISDSIDGGLQIVGIVSQPNSTDEYAVAQLNFWPCFIPYRHHA
jgi:hypothetical protein